MIIVFKIIRMKSERIIIPLVVVSLILIIGVLAFFLWNKRGGGDMLADYCYSSGGTYRDGICSCASLFPKFNTSTGRCEDLGGNTILRREEYDTFQKRAQFVFSCDAATSDVYILPNSQLTFCYPRVFGDPKVESDFLTGHYVNHSVQFIVSGKPSGVIVKYGDEPISFDQKDVLEQREYPIGGAALVELSDNLLQLVFRQLENGRYLEIRYPENMTTEIDEFTNSLWLDDELTEQ